MWCGKIGEGKAGQVKLGQFNARYGRVKTRQDKTEKNSRAELGSLIPTHL